MKDSKKHFIVIRLCIFICAFIYIDSYIIPFKQSREVIKTKEYFESRVRRTKYKTYYIETTKRKFDATMSFYDLTVVTDSVILHSSPLTKSIQKISVIKKDNLYTFEVGYVRASTGFIYVPIVLIILILFDIFYFSIKWLPGRRNLLIAVIMGTLLLFFFHLGIVFK